MPTPIRFVPFDNLARYPDRFRGVRIVIHGEVQQVIEDSDGTCLRVNMTEGDYGWWDDTVMVCWSGAAVLTGRDARILKCDIIYIDADGAGLYTYETVLGAHETVPLLRANYVIAGR